VTTGSYYDTGGTQQGFVRTRNGTFTKFDPSNGNFGQQQIYPTAINPAGAVTGYYQSADYTFHGFLRAPNGTLTTFDAPGSTYTAPSGINPTGTITGNYSDASGSHGFLQSRNGTFTSFDPPGSTGTAPSAINPAGEIAEWYYDASFNVHGFLRIPAHQENDTEVPGATTEPVVCRHRLSDR
jgi:hypothetical protein